jgi:hypothetical protein
MMINVMSKMAASIRCQPSVIVRIALLLAVGVHPTRSLVRCLCYEEQMRFGTGVVNECVRVDRNYSKFLIVPAVATSRANAFESALDLNLVLVLYDTNNLDIGAGVVHSVLNLNAKR